MECLPFLGSQTSLFPFESVDREGPKHVQLQADGAENISLTLVCPFMTLRSHVVTKSRDCSSAQPASSLVIDNLEFFFSLSQCVINDLFEGQLGVEKLCIVGHCALLGSSFCVESQLAERFLHLTLPVEVQDCRKHLILSFFDLDKAIHGREGNFEEPFLANFILDGRFKWLEMKPFLAQVEPVEIASLPQQTLRLGLELLSLKSEVLLNKALVDKGIEDEAQYPRLDPPLHRLDLDLVHLV